MFRYVLLPAVFIILAVPIHAQDENVYLIKIFGCTHKPVERSQTGFRVQGVTGIVTALHGVADCQKITASSKKGLKLDQPLMIKRIDADRDVALLSSVQIESAPDGGLRLPEKVTWESLGTVKVYGHPHGISSLERTLLVSNPALKPLKDLVPPGPLSILRERRSPNHLINVLNLQGHLLPGHSGAPILDVRGHIVAVANGGLNGGSADISWAIPFEDIEWDANIYNRLKALAQYDPTVLFDYETGDQPAEVGTSFCGQISKLIAESHTKFESRSIVGERNLRGAAGEYKSKIPLPGAIDSFVFPGRYVRYRISVARLGWVTSEYKTFVDKLSGCLPVSTKTVIKSPPQKNEQLFFREVTVFKSGDKIPSISVYYKKLTDKFELSLFLEIESIINKQ